MNAIQYMGDFLKNMPRWIFTFTSLESLTQVLILLGALYLVFSLAVFIIIGIRRVSKRWRNEAANDLIRLKLIAVSFLYTTLTSLIFLPYIAVVFWIAGYFFMKQRLEKDIFALWHMPFSDSPHPWTDFQSYKESLKDDIQLDREGLLSFRRIYLCSSIVIGIVFWCGVLTQTERIFSSWLLLLNANMTFAAFIAVGFVLEIVIDETLIIPDNGGKWGWLAALILIFGVGGNMLVLYALNLI